MKILETIPHGRDVRCQLLAKQTAGFNPKSIQRLVSDAFRIALRRIGKHLERGEEDSKLVDFNAHADVFTRISRAGVCLTLADVEAAMDHLRKEQAEDIGAPHIPQVLWSDIGGLAQAKKDILETIQVLARNQQ